MTTQHRSRYLILALSLALLAVGAGLLWHLHKLKNAAAPFAGDSTSVDSGDAMLGGTDATGTTGGHGYTDVFAHNLMLRKGPSFRIYVRWLRGQIVPTHRNAAPSLDDPDSFVLNIQTGVVRANVGDINHFLNSGGTGNHAPVTNITLSGDGNQMKLDATLHKVVPLHIELQGTIAAASQNRIQIHVNKIDVLKVPMKWLLGGLHVTLADLFHPQGTTGIEVSGNDIFLDTLQVLPPPHIRGTLTYVHFIYPDVEEVYGNAGPDVAHVEQWRNFLKLSHGTLDFGKLTMNNVDLIMVDISNDAWFDLDLANYQKQLVNGYTRMTPQSGLQIFMPDLDTLPKAAPVQNTNLDWLKNRNIAAPAEILKQTKKQSAK